MRRWAAVLSALAITCTAATAVAGTASAENDNDPYTLSDGHAAGPMQGIVPARDASHGPKGSSSVPPLTWHGGEIVSSADVQAIYWGSSWGNSTFVGDKISGLDSFYAGLSNSHYMKTNTEYDGTNGQVGTGVNLVGHVIDTSPAPTRAPSTSTVLAEVQTQITNPVPGGYYPVYVDTPRGHTGYCAWHSFGVIGTTPVTFGFFFNLDGDAGCDPGDSTTAHSQGLAALANVSGHEISETFTDPRNGGWWDSSGAENADKCAWKFATANGGTSTLSNGSVWKIQGNWSNAAYQDKAGYDSTKGCLVYK